MKRLKVVFDEQIFLLQDFGGISRYFIELIKAFQANPNLGVDVHLSSRLVRSTLAFEELSTFQLQKIGLPRALFTLLLGTVQRRIRRANLDADVVHTTFYVPGYLGRFHRAPIVSTIHDMIPEIVTKPKRLISPHMMKKSFVSSSDAVLSVSENTLADARRLLTNVPEAFVSHLGVGPEFSKAIPKHASLPDKYFLYVGARQNYKDAETAIKAFASAIGTKDKVNLVFVGGGKFSKTEEKLVSELGIDNLVKQTNLSNAILPSAYANSLALLFTSHYEGFGLPLVEAMASALPVLVADTPVAREIVQNAGNYFRAGDTQSLAKLIREVLSNPSSFQESSALGLRLAESYTWLACAQKTAEAYRFAVQRKSRKAREI